MYKTVFSIENIEPNYSSILSHCLLIFLIISFFWTIYSNKRIFKIWAIVLIIFTVFFSFIEIDFVYSLKKDLKNRRYLIVEGYISNFIPSDYTKKKVGSFNINGVIFKDPKYLMYNHFDGFNGLQNNEYLKIYYQKMDDNYHTILKIMVNEKKQKNKQENKGSVTTLKPPKKT